MDLERRDVAVEDLVASRRSRGVGVGVAVVTLAA